MVSVKDLDFGAVGDGVTDDTSAFQSAINSVSAGGGGDLIVPAGSYIISQISVPSSNVVHLRGIGEQSVIKSSSATLDVLTIGAWYSSVSRIKFVSAVTRTAGAYIVLQGAHTAADSCHLDGDYIGIKMVGVGSKAVANIFDNGANGSKRIWATGGDTSQIVERNLMNAQSPGVAAGIYVDNSSALKVFDNNVICQGSGLLMAPGTGQAVFSLWSRGNFYDNGVNGILVSPSGNGGVYRCSSTDDWGSSGSGHGVLISSSGSTSVNGLDIDGGEFGLNTESGIAMTGAGVKNIRIRDPLVRQNTTGISIGPGVSAVSVSGARAGASDGLSANQYGAYIDPGAVSYSFSDCDLAGQSVSSVSGHVQSAAKTFSGCTGFVTERDGIATIQAGASAIVVSHGLGAKPSRVFLTPHGDNAGRFWTQQTSWTATTFTISQNTTLGYAQPFSWRAVV